MSEIGGSGSEVGGGSEVSSSEVSEAPAAETGGDASEATQEVANEQANESGGFEDDETETTMEDDESDEDVSDMDEESDESQDVGFEDSEGVDNTDDNPEDSDIDNNEETEMSDEDKVGFDDEEEFDAEESVEEENSTDDIDPLNEDSDDADNSEHEDYLDDEDNIEDNDDSDDEDLLEEDTGEPEEYSDETEEEPEATDAELEDSEADEDGEADDDHIDESETEDEAEEQTEDADAELEDNEADEDGEADDDHIDETETEDEAEEQTEATDAELEDSETDEDGEADDDHIDETETEDEAEEQTEDTDAELEDSEADEDGEADDDHIDETETEDEAEEQTEDTDAELEDSETDEDGEADDDHIDETETEDEAEEQTEDTDAELEDNEADEDGDPEGDHLDAQYEEDEAEDDEYIEDEYDEEEDPGDIEQYTEDPDEREEDTSETDEEDNDEDEDDERELEEINEEAAEQVEQEAIENNAEDNIKNETEIAEDENKKVAEDVPDADEATVDSNDSSLDDQVVEVTSDVESSEQDNDNSDLEENFDEDEEDYLDEGELEEYGEDEQRTEQNDTESEKADVENDASKAEQNAEDDDSSESKGAYEKAMSNMTEYMSEHNYGPDDYAEYSQDPEWQKLNAELKQSMGEEATTETMVEDTNIDYDSAMANMANYMNEHNYGQGDYAEYSQDPEWQKLNNDLKRSMESKEFEGKADVDTTSEQNSPLHTPSPNNPENLDGNNLSPESNNEVNKAEIEKIKNEGFLTNDGERVTYQEAVDRVTGKAEEYMKDMGVSDDKISEVKADMEQELYKQEIEARSRGIGDHGIRHIYGNVERGEQYLSSRDDVSSEQKLGVLVAQTYHDEGYSLKNDKVDNSGVLHGGADKKHDEASLDVWNSKKEMYSDVLSKETMASVDKAIGEHNIGSSDKLAVNEESGIAEKTGKYDKNNEEDKKVIEAGEEDGRAKIKENTSSNADVVVSTVHISDKLALSEREKFSDALLKDPKLVEVTEGMNSTFQTIKNEKFGFYDGNGTKPENLTPKGKEFMEQYHQKINDYIDSKYSEPDASRMKTAVEKDIGFNSGSFSSKMNYIYTPSDCYKYNPETKTNEITVYKIDHGDTKSSDLQNEQLDKLFDDLGLDKKKREDAIKQGGFEDKERGLSVHVETKTVDEIKALEAEKYQENNDLKETNERIEAGRTDYEDLDDDIRNVVKERAPQNINYKEYRSLCKAGEIDDVCSENTWEKCQVEQKQQMVSDVVAQSILNKVDYTLRKEE